MSRKQNDDHQDIYKSSFLPLFSYIIFKHCSVVLAGDSGVGKTNILNRYIKGNIPKNIVPTIGVEFATKIVPLKNGDKIKAQIWDTGFLINKNSLSLNK